MDFARTIRSPRAIRYASTLALLVLAFFVAALVWQFYVSAPWTRDGQVRVQVASIAPQVSGQIVELRVVDNQIVKKGDVLYVINDFDFKIALESAKASLQSSAADLQVKRAQASRREALSTTVVAAEQQQQYVGSALMAEAAYSSAQAQLSQAEVNLKRTQVMSPVNGYVTNLLMRTGDYATAGAKNIFVVDSDSYWIDGYFEETKLARIRVGNQARADLMGYAAPVMGRVASVTRGIATTNATPSTQGLPDVNPVYTWVRLAQRVPVRIAIEKVPDGVPLVAGMTATVTVQDTATAGSGVFGRFGANVRQLFGGQRLIPADATTTDVDGAKTVNTLPVPQVTPLPPPDKVEPRLPLSPDMPRPDNSIPANPPGQRNNVRP